MLSDEKSDLKTKFQLFEGSGLDWFQLIVSLLYCVIVLFKLQKSWKEYINFKKSVTCSLRTFALFCQSQNLSLRDY